MLTFKNLKRIKDVNWFVVSIIVLISCVGLMMQYSAAGGSFSPWVIRQVPRLGVGIVLMLLIAASPLKFWFNKSYIFYILTVILLVVVELMGYVGMGAQRWISFGFFNLQPSELVKFSLILALSRYFSHATYEEMGRLRYLAIPVILILVPAFLILRQPDLGTAVLVLASGFIVFFLAGLRVWKIFLGFILVGASLPILWHVLHDYQRQRVLTFLDPERDPLGAGYHILQSKIALGSGGFWGKGFMHGTQSYLNFLPEKQTDFIFTMLCEEFGMFGGLVLISLYMILLFYGYAIMAKSRSPFSKFLSLGITSILFLYMFINIAMVTGLLPVVGIPLPLVSYGGTQLMTLLMGLGLLMCCDLHATARL